MINVTHFRELIIRQTLKSIHSWTPASEELLLGTALQESSLIYLKQLGKGPALGLYQMEPRTHDDIWTNFLAYSPLHALRVEGLTKFPKVAGEMVGNLWYATAMCRMHYLRVAAPLPESGDVKGMAAYWKEYYNTHLGAGTEEEYIENWEAHVHD